MPLKIDFGVQSGSGFFVDFENDTPLMNSDPVCAKRMTWQECLDVVEKMEELGFSAKIFQINLITIE